MPCLQHLKLDYESFARVFYSDPGVSKGTTIFSGSYKSQSISQCWHLRPAFVQDLRNANSTMAKNHAIEPMSGS